MASVLLEFHVLQRRAVGHMQLCSKHYWGKAFCHLSAKARSDLEMYSGVNGFGR